MKFPPSRRLTAGTDFPWPPHLTTSRNTASHLLTAEPAMWEYATGASATGRPVLLIHGFRGDHHGLALIAHDLRGRQVWVPDLPGFGRTPPSPEGLTLDAFTSHIRALCAACEEAAGQAPLLVGHSFGSVLVAHAFAQDPTISPGLGLLSPIVQPALEGSARFLTHLTRLYYAAGAALPERAGAALLAHPAIVRAMSEVMATSRSSVTRRLIHDQHALYFSDYADRRSLAQAYDVSVTHTVAEVAAALAKAARPVLVIAGDADLIAPIDATHSFATDLRDRGADVEAHTLAGVGHLLHYERPHTVAAAIQQFVQRFE